MYITYKGLWMLRSVAVTRIQDGLGFATRQSDKIILRLQEAQRELERGKTLPRFLLQEQETLTLPIGVNYIAVPDGFLRLHDENPLHFFSTGSTKATFITVTRSYDDALKAIYTGTSRPPRVAALRYLKSIAKYALDFVNNADTTYTIYWSYYKAAALLTTEIENEWLANGPEWLIGEAGWRMAMDARDKEGAAIFDAMRKTGRAAIFGETVAFEESSGPLIMGADL